MFLNAWFELDAERERPNVVTRRQAFTYAEDYEFSDTQKEDLWYCITRMDAKFLVWWRKKQPRKGGTHGKSN